jgi:hypothetical protein
VFDAAAAAAASAAAAAAAAAAVRTCMHGKSNRRARERAKRKKRWKDRWFGWLAWGQACGLATRQAGKQALHGYPISAIVCSLSLLVLPACVDARKEQGMDLRTTDRPPGCLASWPTLKLTRDWQVQLRTSSLPPSPLLSLPRLTLLCLLLFPFFFSFHPSPAPTRSTDVASLRLSANTACMYVTLTSSCV